jgi:hypothetical protein
MKLAGGREFGDKLDLAAFKAQAKEYETDGSAWDTVLKAINTAFREHPFAPCARVNCSAGWRAARTRDPRRRVHPPRRREAGPGLQGRREGSIGTTTPTRRRPRWTRSGTPSRAEGRVLRRLQGRRAMKVLIVGGGGREHALAWKLRRDDPQCEILAAPGNPGIAARPLREHQRHQPRRTRHARARRGA